tara:strand:- start:587 stop:1339 length:753 start_codon:yes stop_codon:yes gene_type:complete
VVKFRRLSTSRWWNNRKSWIIILFFLILLIVRLSKTFIFRDTYYFITKPFWPGEYQQEILKKSLNQELSIKLNQLERDNLRLRQLLDLQKFSDASKLNASVISRNTGSWWRKIILNKGSQNAVSTGDAVIGPGGLIGIVENTSKLTSSVQLLTAPNSKVGVWNQRANLHGLLIGVGTKTPKLLFYSKNVEIQIGDYILSSPASTILPPNIPIGIIQSIDNESQPNTIATVQLTAKPEAIDWVQIFRMRFE